jgi:hypothetical protein
MGKLRKGTRKILSAEKTEGKRPVGRDNDDVK